MKPYGADPFPRYETDERPNPQYHNRRGDDGAAIAEGLEDMPAPILLDEHLGWECPECGDPECDSFYAGCSIRVEPRCVFETYPDGVPPLGVVCSCPKHSPRCM